MVIGTTGFTEEQKEKLVASFAAKDPHGHFTQHEHRGQCALQGRGA
ncbi:MAG: hypothetical protein MZV70_73130 [Desulfobacterales bacterium]|nr:hypothetical protein [Desulfobacterales bacterium]